MRGVIPLTSMRIATAARAPAQQEGALSPRLESGPADCTLQRNPKGATLTSNPSGIGGCQRRVAGGNDGADQMESPRRVVGNFGNGGDGHSRREREAGNGTAGQVFVGRRASEAQGAGQRLRLPSPYLRVAI